MTTKFRISVQVSVIHLSISHLFYELKLSSSWFRGILYFIKYNLTEELSLGFLTILLTEVPRKPNGHTLRLYQMISRTGSIFGTVVVDVTKMMFSEEYTLTYWLCISHVWTAILTHTTTDVQRNGVVNVFFLKWSNWDEYLVGLLAAADKQACLFIVF